MVIIPILGQAFLDVYKAFKNAGDSVATAGVAADAGNAVASASASIGFLPLLLGFLAAFFAGWAACKWMVKLVKNVNLTGFAIYCAIVGILCVVLPYLIK
jgi:undecaprenyl pyrophosphate phosphatase UppP